MCENGDLHPPFPCHVQNVGVVNEGMGAGLVLQEIASAEKEHTGVRHRLRHTVEVKACDGVNAERFFRLSGGGGECAKAKVGLYASKLAHRDGKEGFVACIAVAVISADEDIVSRLGEECAVSVEMGLRHDIDGIMLADKISCVRAEGGLFLFGHAEDRLNIPRKHFGGGQRRAAKTEIAPHGFILDFLTEDTAVALRS